MHRILILLIVIGVIAGGFFYYNSHKESVENTLMQTVQKIDTQTNSLTPTNSTENPKSNTDRVTVIAQHLDTPWSLAFMPDGSILVSERKGSIKKVSKEGAVSLVGNIACNEMGEGGLLGIALQPGFDPDNQDKNDIYVYCTIKTSGTKSVNQVDRYDYPELGGYQLVVNNIPGSSNHDGGRIKFGPDGYLYIGTGDAENPSQAQDTNSLAGKILRVNPYSTNEPAPGNPFNNLVYSYGHRNVQGLTWDKDGQLWATEHGPSGLQSCCDEVNKIELGKNYGWPTIQDTQTKEGMLTPKKSSGKDTWAPSGMAYLNGALYFAGLRGQALYKVTLQGNSITDFKTYLKGEYGRLRDVVVGPDGMLYLTTSNQDGRGTPKEGDDKIIRVYPEKL